MNWILNDAAPNDTALTNVYALFGAETTLVPMPCNGDLGNDTQPDAAFATSKSPESQSELRRSSIGVQCGKESRGLYGITFRNKGDCEAFLVRNPKLRRSLTIEHQGSVTLFVRIQEPMPPSLHTRSCSWLSEGAVVLVFCREYPTQVRVVSPFPPVQIPSAEVVFNDELFVRFKQYAALLRFGPAFSLDKKGRQIVNVMFWAGWFESISAIRFLPNARQFSIGREDGSIAAVSELVVANKLLEFMTTWREGVSATVISPVVLTRCVGALKLLAVEPEVHEAGADDVDRFLGQWVELCNGSDATSEELYECYRDWSKTSNVIPLAGRQFYTTLSGRVAKMFSVGKNHCTKRDGKERRGYSGLRIKKTEGSQDARDA
jgi:hypothetical protein